MQVRSLWSYLKTNVMENKRLQWNLDLTKGQETDNILELPNDGFLLNSLKTLFSLPTQNTFRCLEMHSKWCYKICTCSVILGKVLRKLYMNETVIYRHV